jgi:hypothetical protein
VNTVPVPVGTLPTNKDYFTLTSSKTRSFNSASGVVITLYNYNKKHKVEVWLDESSRAPSIDTFDAGGKLAFTINNAIQDQTRIRYSVYETVVEQRQAVSKALKFKPQADE